MKLFFILDKIKFSRMNFLEPANFFLDKTICDEIFFQTRNYSMNEKKLTSENILD